MKFRQFLLEPKHRDNQRNAKIRPPVSLKESAWTLWTYIGQAPSPSQQLDVWVWQIWRRSPGCHPSTQPLFNARHGNSFLTLLLNSIEPAMDNSHSSIMSKGNDIYVDNSFADLLSSLISFTSSRSSGATPPLCQKSEFPTNYLIIQSPAQDHFARDLRFSCDRVRVRQTPKSSDSTFFVSLAISHEHETLGKVPHDQWRPCNKMAEGFPFKTNSTPP